jgi:hypothetical protein
MADMNLNVALAKIAQEDAKVEGEFGKDVGVEMLRKLLMDLPGQYEKLAIVSIEIAQLSKLLSAQNSENEKAHAIIILQLKDLEAGREKTAARATDANERAVAADVRAQESARSWWEKIENPMVVKVLLWVVSILAAIVLGDKIMAKLHVFGG